MKKFLVKTAAVFSLLLFSTTSAFASEDADKPITVNELPQPALTLIAQNFANHQVALAKMEVDLLDRSYNVFFTNGDKLEFDRKGNWTEISCKKDGVPAVLIPQPIADYVKTHQPDAKIIKIERENKRYEVNLSNGFEYTFNKKFQPIDVDR